MRLMRRDDSQASIGSTGSRADIYKAKDRKFHSIKIVQNVQPNNTHNTHREEVKTKTSSHNRGTELLIPADLLHKIKDKNIYRPKDQRTATNRSSKMGISQRRSVLGTTPVRSLNEHDEMKLDQQYPSRKMDPNEQFDQL